MRTRSFLFFYRMVLIRIGVNNMNDCSVIASLLNTIVSNNNVVDDYLHVCWDAMSSTVGEKNTKIMAEGDVVVVDTDDNAGSPSSPSGPKKYIFTCPVFFYKTGESDFCRKIKVEVMLNASANLSKAKNDIR